MATRCQPHTASLCASKSSAARACRVQGVKSARQSVASARPYTARVSLTNRRSTKSQVVTMALPSWDAPGGMQQYLVQEKLVSLRIEGIQQAMSEGVPLLDVRAPEDFVDVHAKDAVSVPLYTPISGFSPVQMMRRVVYAANGMAGTELNENFVADVVAAIPDKSEPIIVMCDSGGSYEATATSGLEAKKSRSLIACYLLMQEGYENVLHAEGGLRDWARLEMPVVGEDIEAWVQKAAMMP